MFPSYLYLSLSVLGSCNCVEIMIESLIIFSLFFFSFFSFVYTSRV